MADKDKVALSPELAEAIKAAVAEALKAPMKQLQGFAEGTTDLVNALSADVEGLKETINAGPMAGSGALPGTIDESVRLALGSIQQQLTELQSNAQMRPLNGAEQKQRHDAMLKKESLMHGPRPGMPVGDVAMYHPEFKHEIARTPEELQMWTSKGYFPTMDEAAGGDAIKRRVIWERAAKPQKVVEAA